MPLSSLDMWQWSFIILWLHRYIRFIVNTISHWVYKSIPIPSNPSFGPEDVTVIIPTIHNNFEELREPIQSILACQPHQLILVTTDDKKEKLRCFVKSLEVSNVSAYSAPIANKRIQVCEAIPKVKTPILIMADDDVTWPRTILPWLLAPFENAKIGAVGPCQRVKRVRDGTFAERAFNWLGAAYIERRNFEISATHGIDGGTSCMSGRTCAFRSEILKSPLFLEGFKTERWGQYQLNADDDNFVTRWLVTNQWSTWIQYNRECEIETTLENNSKYLAQCLRWARSNWRSNYTSLVTERHVWRQQPWCVYALHIATFTSLSFVFDPLIIFLSFKATASWSPDHQMIAIIAQLVFMFISKVVKLIGLFIREPKDIAFLPISILFGYFHGGIKLNALRTLRMTSWGSRADGDANDSHRMSPRARSSSISLPGPVLPRFKDELEPPETFDSHSPSASEKPLSTDSYCFDDVDDESNLDSASDASYDANDSHVDDFPSAS